MSPVIVSSERSYCSQYAKGIFEVYHDRSASIGSGWRRGSRGRCRTPSRRRSKGERDADDEQVGNEQFAELFAQQRGCADGVRECRAPCRCRRSARVRSPPSGTAERCSSGSSRWLSETRSHECVRHQDQHNVHDADSAAQPTTPIAERPAATTLRELSKAVMKPAAVLHLRLSARFPYSVFENAGRTAFPTPSASRLFGRIRLESIEDLPAKTRCQTSNHGNTIAAAGERVHERTFDVRVFAYDLAARALNEQVVARPPGRCQNTCLRDPAISRRPGSPTRRRRRRI